MFTVWLEEYGESRDVMTTSSEKQAEKFCDELNTKFEREYGIDNEDSPRAYINRIDDYAALGENRIPYSVYFREDGSVSKVEVSELGLCWFPTLAHGGEYVKGLQCARLMAWDDEHAIELANELREKKMKQLEVKVCVN